MIFSNFKIVVLVSASGTIRAQSGVTVGCISGEKPSLLECAGSRAFVHQRSYPDERARFTCVRSA